LQSSCVIDKVIFDFQHLARYSFSIWGHMDNHQLARQEYRLEAFDPFEVSTQALVVIAFPKSTSKNFAFALSLAEGADRFGTFAISGKPMYVAAFSKTEADAGRAIALLNYVATWKGSLIFSRGRMIQSGYKISQVIDCYINSCACSDRKAYCHKIIDDPFSELIQSFGMSFSISFVEKPKMKQNVQIDRYAFPCQFLLPYFRFQREHPSAAQNQIQAAGVQQGCNVCPNFHPEEFEKVGFRTVQKDAFE
jgi:hypothetical protein